MVIGNLLSHIVLRKEVLSCMVQYLDERSVWYDRCSFKELDNNYVGTYRYQGNLVLYLYLEMLCRQFEGGEGEGAC